MAVEVDVRGLSCPIPVVRAKDAIQKNPGKELKVILDNKTAVENVSRLAKNSGYSIKTGEEGEDYTILMTPGK